LATLFRFRPRCMSLRGRSTKSTTARPLTVRTEQLAAHGPGGASTATRRTYPTLPTPAACPRAPAPTSERTWRQRGSDRHLRPRRWAGSQPVHVLSPRYHACMRADSFARPTTQHTLPCPRHSCCYDWLTQAVLLQVPFARSRSRCLPNPISATWRRQSVRQNTERTAIGYSRYARPRTDLLLMPTTLPSVRC
jgi:hypothetical protein